MAAIALPLGPIRWPLGSLTAGLSEYGVNQYYDSHQSWAGRSLLSAMSLNKLPRCDRPHPVLTESAQRSEEHTSELQSRGHLVCRLLLEKKNKKRISNYYTLS